MIPVLEKVHVGQSVIRISDGSWFTVEEIPRRPNREPKPYFIAKRNGSLHWLSYTEVTDAYPFKCLCGEGFEGDVERNNHLDEMWGDGTTKEGTKHGKVLKEYE